MIIKNNQLLQWEVFDSAETVAQVASQTILVMAEQAIKARNCFRLVLAGGRTPERTYQLLCQAKAMWTHWHIYYGDERCLPIDDPERNSVMAKQAWLNQVAIPATQIYPIPAQFAPTIAAKQYAQTIANILPFDLVLLGMGEDGHTASLFPEHLYASDELVHAVFEAPKPPAERVSLSVKALSETRQLLFLVTGISKQAAVTAWRRGEDLPVARICPKEKGRVLTDLALTPCC